MEYQLLEELDRGGFGRVERVQNDEGELFARKVFSPTTNILQVADQAKLLKRFCREVKTQQRLDGNLFIPVLDYDLTCPEPWYVMPLADKNYLKKIEEDRAAGTIDRRPIADIINSLEELHRLGLVHRDLKPQNILLHEGQWKLSDLGFVSPGADSTTTCLTSTASAWGTALYCAPEQLHGFNRVTPAADIYSFGCILHDLVDGSPRTPYRQQSANGTIGRFIEKCTNQDPDRRFSSAAKMRSPLFKILSGQGAISPTAEEAQWIQDLQDLSNWSSEKLSDFVAEVNKRRSCDGEDQLLSNITRDHFKELATKKVNQFRALGTSYCEWISGASFDFDFCDLLAGRLEEVYRHADTDLRAQVILSMARFAVRHNRYYVMRRLFALSGPELDDDVAERVQLEIELEEREGDFKYIANVTWNHSLASFHRMIFDHLSS